MNPFDYYNPTLLVYGLGKDSSIGEILKDMGLRKILLHYGGGSIKKNGIYDRITNSLEMNGISYIELGGVCPNPHLSLVRQGIDICRQNNIDLILAVGGGSVIDSAKAIAAGTPTDLDIWDIFKKKIRIEKALKVATVLTIPAAGSEASPNTVITDEINKDKIGYGSKLLYPVFSIINPENFMTLPSNQIANGISDMMSHIMERYFTNTTSTDLTDSLCEAALRTIIKNARILVREPKNYEALEQLGICATMAHNGILGLGRDEDWACHGMGHELSGLYDVAHGSTLSVITPAWMQYVRNENKGIFEQFATNVFGVNTATRDADKTIDEGIYLLTSFYREIGLPTNMSQIGAMPEDYEFMAKKATREGSEFQRTLGGIKKLNYKDVLNIYKLATL